MKWMLVCLLAACSGPDDSDGDKVTYYRDIQPIVGRSCVSCHVLGGTGPFPLDNYNALYMVREVAREKIVAREMPPWFTSRECNDYWNDLSLTDEEIALVEKWVDQGALEGDPDDAPAPVEDTAVTEEDRGIGDIDFQLGMQQPYFPTSDDNVHCFNLVWPAKEPTYITGMNIKTGNAGIMHHITLNLIEPAYVKEYIGHENENPDVGYVCEETSGAMDEGTATIAGWTGGSKVTKYPDGTGFPVQPGSLIQLQTHFTPTANEVGKASDETAIQFATEDNAAQAYLEIVVDESMIELDPMLPKDDPDVLIVGEVEHVDEPDVFWVISASFHMHYLGIGGGIAIKHADGTKDCVIDLTGWNPDWQQAYGLQTPLLFDSTAGDTWEISCHWDNSQENQPIIGGEQRETVDIRWGTPLDQEMCRSSVREAGLTDEEKQQLGK